MTVSVSRTSRGSPRGRGALLLTLLGGCLWANPDFQGVSATATTTTTGPTTGASTSGTGTPTTTSPGTWSGGTAQMSASGTTEGVTAGGSGSTTDIASSGLSSGATTGATTGSTNSAGSDACPTHANIIACYDIPANETAVLVDGSKSHHGTMTGINLEDSVEPEFGKALALGKTSMVAVPEDPAFDPPQLTVSLLIRPDGDGQILDNDNEYGLRVVQSTVECSIVTEGNGGATATRPIVKGEWSLIGCSFDGSNVELWVLHAGNNDAIQMNLSGTLNPNSSTGLVVGNESPVPDFPITALVDRLLLFNTRLDPSEVCTFYAPFC